MMVTKRVVACEKGERMIGRERDLFFSGRKFGGCYGQSNYNYDDNNNW